MGVLNICGEGGVKLKKIIITTIISLVSGLSIQAQTVQAVPDKTPNTKEEKPQDYSKGFEVFYKLGLPDVSNAEYIYAYGDLFNNLYSLGPSYHYQMKGNAWLLKKEEGNSPASLIIFNTMSVNAYNEKKLFDEFKKRNKDKKLEQEKENSEFYAENKSKTMLFWHNVDIKEESEMLLSQLENIDKENFSYQKEISGPLFLYAIQIYSKGFKDEANKIISRLFELSGDKKVILLAAMNTLANQQYGEAILNLEKNKDWKKFEADLEALLKKYPKGWKTAPGIKLLSEMVKKQLTKTHPPEIKGEGISVKDSKLASELVGIKEIPYYCGVGWLFQENGNEKNSRIRDEVLKKMTKNSIPMLIALLKEDYMIPAGLTHSNHNCRGNSENRDPAEEILSTIPYPANIKTIAKAILAPVVVVPDMQKDSNVMEMSDEDFINLCNKWYEEIKDKTTDELALYYLKNGVNDQPEYAMLYIMNKNIGKSVPVIEEHFLNMQKEILSQNIDYGVIQFYVTTRMKATRPFVEKLRGVFKNELAAAAKEKKKDKAVKKEAEMEEEENESDEENMGMLMELEKAFKIFDEFTSGKSAEEIIDEIVSGKRDLDDRMTYTHLRYLMNEMDRDEAVGIFLDGISKIGDNASLKYELIHMYNMVRNYSPDYNELIMRGIEVPEPAEKKIEKPLHIGKNMERWKRLLADKTKYKNHEISTITACVMEDIYGSEEDALKMDHLEKAVGGKSISIVMKRAEERLAGKAEKDLTSYPEIKELDETAEKKLTERLEKSISEKKEEEFIRTLDYSEFAALPKLVSENPKLSTGLKDFANRVVFVESSLKGEEKVLDAFKNTVLDLKGVENIQDHCKRFTAERKMFHCIIYRADLFGGVSIEMSGPDKRIKAMLENMDHNNHDFNYMSGRIEQEGYSEYSRWEVGGQNGKENENEIVVDGKKIKLEASGRQEKENEWEKKSQEKFVKCLEKALGDGEDCSKSFSISFMDPESTLEYMR